MEFKLFEAPVAVRVTSFRGKMVKVKQGIGKSVAKPRILLAMEVPITAALRDLLPLGLQKAAKLDGAANEANIRNITLDGAENGCFIGFRPYQDFKSKPKLEMEGKVQVTALEVRKDDSCLHVKVSTPFNSDFWAWGGRRVDDEQVVFSAKAVEGDLPLVGLEIVGKGKKK
jgi:hypothetical protein